MISVSVIIPVYNGEKWIIKCLDSIAAQEIECEIIVIDDGSTDNTLSICNLWAEKHLYTKVITQENSGVSKARNRGIKEATAEWITFIDADDCFLDNAFEVLSKEQTKDAQIILAGYTTDEDYKGDFYTLKTISHDILSCGVVEFARYEKYINKIALVDNYNNWACWGKFFRREFLINNNIRFPVGVALTEDAVFCFHAYNMAKKILATRQIIYYYRRTGESVTSHYHPNLLENNEKIIFAMEMIRKELNIQDKWEKEISTFYARLIVQSCVESLKRVSSEAELQININRLKNICEKEQIQKALKNTSYFYLIPGNRNKILYIPILFKLKNKKYKEALQ